MKPYALRSLAVSFLVLSGLGVSAVLAASAAMADECVGFEGEVTDPMKYPAKVPIVAGMRQVFFDQDPNVTFRAFPFGEIDSYVPGMCGIELQLGVFGNGTVIIDMADSHGQVSLRAVNMGGADAQVDFYKYPVGHLGTQTIPATNQIETVQWTADEIDQVVVTVASAEFVLCQFCYND